MNLPADCLGPFEAVVRRYEGRGKHKELVQSWNVKLKPDDDQHMVFQEGDPPPFKHPNWSPDAYVGKAKGIDQVLFERGLLDPSAKYTLDGKLDKFGNLIPGTSTKVMLSSCSDFKNQPNLLQELVQQRGHILLSSPKCHPELAGDGIEYAWGHSKRCFRKINTGNEREMARKLRERVFQSIGPDNLTIRRLMDYSRTAREYKLVYRAADYGAGKLEHADIESARRAIKLKRKHRAHRSIDAAVLSAIDARHR